MLWATATLAVGLCWVSSAYLEDNNKHELTQMKWEVESLIDMVEQMCMLMVVHGQ